MEREGVEDVCFNVDMSQSRIDVTVARGKCGFASGTLKDSDKVCFIAGFAKDFGDGGVLGSPKCVGFVGSVVDFHARWFTAYLE